MSEIVNNNSNGSCAITLNNVEFVQFVKPQNILARYVANAIMKDGYYFETKNEKLAKLWEKFKHTNNFDNILWNICYDSSIFNASIYAINRTENNNLVLTKSPNTSLNNFAFNSIEPEIAVLDEMVATSDNNTIVVRRVYTREKTTTEAVDSKSLTKVKTLNNEIKINDDYKIKAVDNHNLGVCPIVIFYNLPFTVERTVNSNPLIRFTNNSLNNFSYDFLKFNFQYDSAFCDNLAQLINQMYVTMWKENIYSRTKVVYNGTNMTEFDYENKLSTMKTQLQNSDFMFNVEGNNEDIKILQNSNKLSDLQNSTINLWADFFWLSGYSFISTVGGAQKSSSEINFMLHQTKQTNMIKRRNMEQCVKAMLYKCIKFWILNGELSESDTENDFIFKINDLSDESESVMIDTITKKLTSNLISQSQAVSQVNRISLDKAKEMLDDIKDENEKYKQEQPKLQQDGNKTQAMGNKNATKSTQTPRSASKK